MSRQPSAMTDSIFRFSDREILDARPAKLAVDPQRPYAYLVEPECSASGDVVSSATLFLTNRECPFRCLMCDLWRHTTDDPVPEGSIPSQIRYALARLPRAAQIKLYNSGNFFDSKAVAPGDHGEIAALVRPFEQVVVENHPRLCGDGCLRFRDLIDGRLEVALGLETVHEDLLAALNKRMTLDDFARAAGFLIREDIDVRAFILLRPPFMSEEEGVGWAIRSIEFAFEAGVSCCSVIPTRAGNGIMEDLLRTGAFSPPDIRSLETVLESGLGMKRGRVFADLWDAERFFRCADCGPARHDRLRRMNLTQEVPPPVSCNCAASGG